MQTDNSHLAEKIALRLRHLPCDYAAVLDCFHGTGRVWSGVKAQKPGVIVVGIDVKRGRHMQGDNVKFLRGMDLSKFDVIDLDSYGIPFQQLEAVFDSGFCGTVFYTMIQSQMGRMPNGILEACGFTAKMIARCPTLFSKRGFQVFKSYLQSRGVDRIFDLSVDRKHYGGFILRPRAAA